MKKRLSLVLAAVLCTGLLAGCSGGSSSSGSTSSAADAGNSKKDKISISVVAGSMAENTQGGIGVKTLVEKLNEYSEGSIEATAYYDTQLGDAKSIVQSLQNGTIDIGVAGNSYFSSIVPEVQALELPYMFDSYDQARSIVDGEVGQELLGMFEKKDVVGLAFWEIGFRQLSNKTKEIRKVEDVKGLKMRTLTAPVQVKLWELYGALPTAIDSSELYTSLQQGVIDGQENPISEIVSKRLYEVQKNVSLTAHVYTPMVLGMSKYTYDKLDDTQKEALKKAVADATEASRNAVTQMEEEGLKTLEENDVNVIKDPDIAQFKEVGKACYSVFTEKYGDDIVNKLEEAKK